MPLENGRAFPGSMLVGEISIVSGQLFLRSNRVPDAHVRIETASDNPFAVEGYRIDLAEMALQSLDTPAFRNAPHFGRGVVASRDDNVAVDLEAADASLMSNQDVAAQAGSDVPDSERRIA